MNGAHITARDPYDTAITRAEYHPQVKSSILAAYLQRALDYLKKL